MNKQLLKKFLIISSITLVISACGKNESKDNFDFSNFKPKIRKSEIVKDISQETEKIKVENKLLPLKKRDEISSSIKYGKKDPFELTSNKSSKLSSNLILKGFISTADQNFALVEYLGEDGTITKDSVGGINTKFLPSGAKVKNLSIIDSKIIILVADQEYVIKIGDQRN